MGIYLITGASSGIGAACAEKLSRDGHTVVLVARSAEKLQQVAGTLSGTAHVFPYDLEDVANVKTIFDFCKDQDLKLDGMVYSAGVNADVPLKVCSPDIWERVMRVNCLAFAEMGRHFYSKRYSHDFSRMVAISSSASISCDKGMGPYSASKAALNAVVKTMAKEFIKRGILVNAILPAGVLTPMAAAKIEALTGAAIDVSATITKLEQASPTIAEQETQPCGIILPSHIATIAAYLVSAGNRYVTGALLPVSGGLAGI
ncbi:MAG: SDR family NAD(P)-dependent oxidoreductase [Schwartzia sp. (in: firmicutes)]